MRSALLQHVHEMMAHASADLMTADIADTYFVPRLRQACGELVEGCHTCFTTRPIMHANGLYARHGTPRHPFDVCQMDVATGLVEEEGYNAILVVYCELTRMVIMTPCSTTTTSEQTYRLLEAKVFAYFGYPSVLKSDQGSCFA